MLSTNSDMQRIGSQITTGIVTFDIVNKFIFMVYLFLALNTKNDVILEIKRMITLANRC